MFEYDTIDRITLSVYKAFYVFKGLKKQNRHKYTNLHLIHLPGLFVVIHIHWDYLWNAKYFTLFWI